MSRDVVIKGSVTGYEEAYQRVKNLADVNERRKIMRGAVRAAGSVVRKAARQAVPQGTQTRQTKFGTIAPGALKKSIAVAVNVDRGGDLSRSLGTFSIRGGVIAGNRKKGIYWAGFVERGTKSHEIKPRGRAIRFMVGETAVFARGIRHPGAKANDFMRRAGYATKGGQDRAFADYVEKRLAALAATGRGD